MPGSCTLFSICCIKPATRTMKNSSMFEPKIDRNFTRSSSGIAAIARFFEHAPLEFQMAQFAIEVKGRIVQFGGICGFKRRLWPLRRTCIR